MWNLPEPRKFDKDVSLLASLPNTGGGSRARQAVISGATMPTLLRIPLVSAFITGLRRLLMISRSPEASEEERSEHEAEHDRDRAVVLLHPCPQGPEHLRGPLWHGCIETDEHENRDSEDHEHQSERHGAASRAEACRSDQVDARDEDREVLDLDREERHPESERFSRCHGTYRLHPPGRLRVGVGNVEEAPEAQDNDQGADRRADDTVNRRGDVSRSGRPAEE